MTSLPARLAPGSTLWLATACAVSVALGWAGHEAERLWRGVPPERPAARPAAEPAAAQAAVPATVPTAGISADPDREGALRDTLRTAAITRVKLGSGGRSLAFKLSLAGGAAGYFKPEQQVSSAHWYAEVAAYHLDRALGLHRVPLVVSRRVPFRVLAPAAAGDPRLHELERSPDGTVRGALIEWLPEKLVPARTPPGWESWVRVSPFPRTAASPYQRPAVYAAALARIAERRRNGEPSETFYDEVPAPPDGELAAALSDMILFDFLTLNYDRFGGGNANLLTRGPSGALVFLDNGDGFSAGPPRRSMLDARLAPVQRFRRRTVQALQALDVVAFGAQLARDPHGPLLDARMLEGLALRRSVVLEHVARQRQRFGDAVFAW